MFVASLKGNEWQGYGSRAGAAAVLLLVSGGTRVTLHCQREAHEPAADLQDMHVLLVSPAISQKAQGGAEDRTGAGVGARGHSSASPQLPLELCPRKSHSQAGIPCVTLLTELLPSPLCLSLNALLTDRLCPEHYPWPHS